MMTRLGRVLAGTVLVLATSGMAPMPRPVADPAIGPAQAASYAGSWSLTLPTREASEGDKIVVACDRPIRIEAANPTHIFYLGPDEVEADAAIELVASGDGADWKPIVGGPAYFALWVGADSFYLYDAVSEGEPDWTAPYVYTRCE